MSNAELKKSPPQPRAQDMGQSALIMGCFDSLTLRSSMTDAAMSSQKLPVILTNEARKNPTAKRTHHGMLRLANASLSITDAAMSSQKLPIILTNKVRKNPTVKRTHHDGENLVPALRRILEDLKDTIVVINTMSERKCVCLYYVYMLTNAYNKVLYTGVTNNLERRLFEHLHPNHSSFTNRYNAHKLVYYETTDDVKAAIAREKQIKGWTRTKKDALIKNMNPEWRDLTDDWME